MFRLSSALLRSHTLAAVAVCVLGLLVATTPAVAKKNKKSEIGEVAGTVTDQQGQQLANIRVTLTDPATSTEVGKAVTGKKGDFELTVDMSAAVAAAGDESPEGEVSPPTITLELRLEGEGYAPFANELQLTAGERLDVQVTMLDAAAGRRNQAIAVYNEGVKLHAEQKLDEAAKKFRRAVEIAPEVPQPYLGLADIALSKGNPEEAVSPIETYRKLSPDEPTGQRLAYEIYRALGRMDEAKQLAEALGIEAADKDLAIQVFNEGAIASQKNDLDTALAKFERAVEMDPNLGPAWAGIASIYYNRRELEQAIDPAAKAVELQPDHEQSQRIYFLVLDGLGKPEAAQAWEAYRALNQPAALELLYLRADLDFRNNDNDSATKALERILSLDADFARAHLLLGKIYASTDVAKAKAHLQKFIELAPADDPDLELAQEMITYM